MIRADSRKLLLRTDARAPGLAASRAHPAPVVQLSLLLTPLVWGGCARTPEPLLQDTDRVQVRIVSDAVFEPLCRVAAELFNERNQRLPNGLPIRSQCQSSGSRSTADYLLEQLERERSGSHEGEESRPSLVVLDGDLVHELLLYRLSRLYPGQTLLSSLSSSPLLASSPVVLLAPLELAGPLRSSPDPFSWFLPTSASSATPGAAARLQRTAIPAPDWSTAGLSALIARFAAGAGVVPSDLDLAQLKATEDLVLESERQVAVYASSPLRLNEPLVRLAAGAAAVAVTYEAGVIALNRAEQGHPIAPPSAAPSAAAPPSAAPSAAAPPSAAPSAAAPSTATSIPAAPARPETGAEVLSGAGARSASRAGATSLAGVSSATGDVTGPGARLSASSTRGSAARLRPQSASLGGPRWQAVYPPLTYTAHFRGAAVHAPWVSEVEAVAARKVLSFFRSEEVQSRVLEQGFRPAFSERSFSDVFGPADGIDPSAQLRGWFAPPPELTAWMLETWQARLRRPLHLTVVIDASSSMAGLRLERVRDALVRLAESLTQGDRLALVTFQTEVQGPLEVPPGEEGRTLVKSTFKGLNLADGSRLYDGLTAALQWQSTVMNPSAPGPVEGTGQAETAGSSVPPHRPLRAVIVLADGPDEGSSQGLEALLMRAGERGPTSPDWLPIHTLGYGPEDTYDRAGLAALAEKSGGRFEEITPERLEEVLLRLRAGY